MKSSIFDDVDFPLTRKQTDCLHLEWQPIEEDTRVVCANCSLKVKTREAIKVFERMGDYEV